MVARSEVAAVLPDRGNRTKGVPLSQPGRFPPQASVGQRALPSFALAALLLFVSAESGPEGKSQDRDMGSPSKF